MLFYVVEIFPSNFFEAYDVLLWINKLARIPLKNILYKKKKN